MHKTNSRQKRHEKSINLALQGGGSHGAFTWGVLDRMFEEDRLWIEGISGALDKDEYREMNMHMIDGCEDMLKLDASSKMNSEWAFLTHLRDIGRDHADTWLKANFDKIEVESTLDLGALFGGVSELHGANMVELRARKD